MGGNRVQWIGLGTVEANGHRSLSQRSLSWDSHKIEIITVLASEGSC